MNPSYPRDIKDRWHRLPPNTRGIVWILGACGFFSLMAVCVKIVGRTIPVWELITLRTVFALMFIAPLWIRARTPLLTTRHWRAHVARSVLGVGGATSFYLAVRHLDLALVTTLSFTRALFVIVLAVIFLGEVLRWRRSVATLVGFAGVLICVQPGTETFEPWTLAGLSFAVFGAGVTTTVKRLTVTEPPLTILIYTYVLMGAFTLIPSLLVWRSPDPVELTLLALLAGLSLLGQGCMILGLRAGEVTALAPFDYARLLFAACFGFVFFGETVETSTWVGAAVIIASTLYIALHAARARAGKS